MKKVLLALADALAIDFERILQQEAVEIVKVSDGQELLDLSREIHPDLIILEKKLPVLDGLSAVLLLKNDPETEKIPVVVVCECKEKQEEDATDAGCDAYLTRPLNPDKIREIIKNYVR